MKNILLTALTVLSLVSITSAAPRPPRTIVVPHGYYQNYSHYYAMPPVAPPIYYPRPRSRYYYPGYVWPNANLFPYQSYPYNYYPYIIR